MDSAFNDKRFAHVTKDPRFRSMPKKERKVKIDRRFQGMFKDDRFKLKYTVDRKGRKTNKTTDEDLKRFYELSDESDDNIAASDSQSEGEAKKSGPQKRTLMKKKHMKEKSVGNKGRNVTNLKKDTLAVEDVKDDRKSGKFKMSPAKRKQKSKTSQTKNRSKLLRDNSSEDSLSEESEDEEGSSRDKQTDQAEESDQESPESGVGSGPDLARGEGNVSSSSDEEEDGDWQPEKDLEIEHNWGEVDKGVTEAKELGRRLAVCNMDWDRIKARDLYVLFSSFKQTGGIILSVTVYPSEFGKQKMAEERVKGPAELMKAEEKAEDPEEKSEGSEYHMERLRQYQLNRLKYFYAVVECDSVQTASHIYDECDGLEYETSSARLDLRFIPDDMEFDQEPHSVCRETPDSSTFEPSTFFTTALCQSKVELTWDETDRDRIAITRKKIPVENINDDDFKAYLASSSEDEAGPYKGQVEGSDPYEDLEDQEEDEETKIQKYKSLVKDLEESEKQKEDRGVEMEITWEPGLKETTEEIVKKKGSKKELSVWEQYLERKKDKKRKRREEKLKERMARKTESQVIEDEEEKEGEGESMAFSDDELPDDIDMNDPYFQSEQEAGKTNKLDSKRKKRKKNKVKLTEAEMEEKQQEQAELSLLMMDEDDMEKRQHFSLQKLLKTEKPKKKRKRKDNEEDITTTEDTFKFNVDDSRFKAMYSSHLYNIDPSAPEFKRTRVMDTIINEKLKRRKKDKNTVPVPDTANTEEKKNSVSPLPDHVKKSSVQDSIEHKLVKDPTISALVNSVKSKTKNYYKKKSK